MKKSRATFRFLAVFLIGCILFSFLVNRAGPKLERYSTRIYQKVSGKRTQHIQYDSAGVPVVYYEGSLGKQYNVVSVAEEALLLAGEKDSASVRNFFICINWLQKNFKPLNDSSIIYYNYYDWSHYGMKAPWRSAMNQGRVMQSFIKAFEKTGDTLFLDYSRKALNTLFTPVNQGGVSYFDNEGYWYEEYADDSVPQSRVLNGMIVVLQALSDFYDQTNDPKAAFLFTNGVNAVKSTLHLYDNNGHSNYDILGRPANPWYHKFHIELLDFLYSETNDPIFNEYKQKWLLFKEPTYLAALIKKPTRIGVFAVFTLFAGVLLIISIIWYFIWFRSKKV